MPSWWCIWWVCLVINSMIWDLVRFDLICSSANCSGSKFFFVLPEDLIARHLFVWSEEWCKLHQIFFFLCSLGDISHVWYIDILWYKYMYICILYIISYHIIYLSYLAYTYTVCTSISYIYICTYYEYTRTYQCIFHQSHRVSWMCFWRRHSFQNSGPQKMWPLPIQPKVCKSLAMKQHFKFTSGVC